MESNILHLLKELQKHGNVDRMRNISWRYQKYLYQMLKFQILFFKTIFGITEQRNILFISYNESIFRSMIQKVSMEKMKSRKIISYKKNDWKLTINWKKLKNY